MSECRTGKVCMGLTRADTMVRDRGGRKYLCPFCGFYHHTMQGLDRVHQRPKRIRKKKIKRGEGNRPRRRD